MAFEYGLVNAEQRQAIDHLDGPCRVTAGAGSGKTSVLTKRIAKLLDRGIEPKNILAITFTKKAAEEMKERLIDLVGEEQGKKVFLGTFHRFGMRIIAWKCNKDGKEFPKIIMGQDQYQIFDRILNPEYGVCHLSTNVEPEVAMSFVSWQKNYLLAPEDKLDLSCLEKPDEVDDAYLKDLRTIYKTYEQIKKKEGLIDFDDMLTRTYLILMRDKEICSICQNLYKYILVDEFQDTNVAQYKIVKKIASGYYKNVFIVGDARQAIYSWRASKVDFILDFEKDWENARTIELNDNYRSTVEVVDISTEVISHSTIHYPGICRSGRGNHGAPIMSFVTENSEDEARCIANFIKYMVEEAKQMSYSDIAILYRLNAQSGPFEDAFVNLDIPYYVAGSEGFYGIREIKEILAYLHLAINPQDIDAFNSIANVPDRGIGIEMANGIRNVAMKYNEPFGEVLVEGAAVMPDGDRKTSIFSFGKLLKKLAIMNKDEKCTVQDMIREILATTQYLEYLKERQKKKTKGADDGSKENMVKTFATQCKRFKNVEALDDHIRKIEEQQADKNKSKVQLMSLHRSKGLEFKTVFLVGMINGLLPHAKSMKKDKKGEIIPESIEEERRLCYVGVTRAKEQLILSSYKMDGTDMAEESVFFKELKGKTKDITDVAKMFAESTEEKSE